MKFPRIITRRRLKWTGLAATLLLAAAMIASYWLWPSYSWDTAESSTYWEVNVEPGGIAVNRFEMRGFRSPLFANGWKFKSRGPQPNHLTQLVTYPSALPSAFIWLPSYVANDYTTLLRQSVEIPLWMPLILIAVPTGILLYRYSKPKLGCCAQCRYDLTGLSSNTCPECGTKIAKTD